MTHIRYTGRQEVIFLAISGVMKKIKTLGFLGALAWSVTAQAFDWQVDGERLGYKISFLGMTAGQAEIFYNPSKTDDTYSVVCRAWAKGGFVKIHDRMTVKGSSNGINGNPFSPVSMEMILNENDYRANKTVDYKYAKSSREDDATEKLVAAEYDNLRDAIKPQLYDISDDTRDVFSALYYLRSTVKELEVGQTYKLPVWDLDRGFELQLKVLKKQKFKSMFGKQDVFLVQPIMISTDGGKKKVKDKWRMKITADGRMIPVEIYVRLPIGSFKARLKRYGDMNFHSNAPSSLPLTGEFKL